MEKLMQICGAALILILCLPIVRDKVPSMGIAMILCAVAVIGTVLIPMLRQVYECVRSLADTTGLDSNVFSAAARVMAISLVVKVMGELCRDAGERTLAVLVETGGAAAGILCAAPVIEKALQLIGAM